MLLLRSNAFTVFFCLSVRRDEGDSQDRTDSVAAGVGANAVSVEDPSISLREFDYAIEKLDCGRATKD